jgi:bloom syndrome protein
MEDDQFIEVPLNLDHNVSVDFLLQKPEKAESAFSRSEGQLEEDMLDCLNELQAIGGEQALDDRNEAADYPYSEMGNCCI